MPKYATLTQIYTNFILFFQVSKLPIFIQSWDLHFLLHIDNCDLLLYKLSRTLELIRHYGPIPNTCVSNHPSVLYDVSLQWEQIERCRNTHHTHKVNCQEYNDNYISIITFYHYSIKSLHYFVYFDTTTIFKNIILKKKSNAIRNNL